VIFVQPASPYLHESSIHKDQWETPSVSNLDKVKNSLGNDMERIMKKYGSREPSPHTARFNSALPQGMQNYKYSPRNSPRSSPRERRSSNGTTLDTSASSNAFDSSPSPSP